MSSIGHKKRRSKPVANTAKKDGGGGVGGSGGEGDEAKIRAKGEV